MIVFADPYVTVVSRPASSHGYFALSSQHKQRKPSRGRNPFSYELNVRSGLKMTV